MIKNNNFSNQIKPMTINQMILALDRMSRFKYPENKLKRVYIETICSNYLSLGSKKAKLELLDNTDIINMFTEIWNFSIICNFGCVSDDFNLNKQFIEEEKKCYFIDKNVLQLMPKKTDFKTLIKNISKNEIPNDFLNYKTPKKIVLTEGITEEILLPEFSKITDFNWIKNNVKIIGTGGKTRVMNQYNILKKQLKIPIFILLDFDAKSIFQQINNELRKDDRIHLISCGEIEDIIPLNLFKNAINKEYKLQLKISSKDFNKNISMVDNLNNIFKQNNYGEFKKAKMANLIKNVISSKIKLSQELLLIFEEVKNM